MVEMTGGAGCCCPSGGTTSGTICTNIQRHYWTHDKHQRRDKDAITPPTGPSLAPPLENSPTADGRQPPGSAPPPGSEKRYIWLQRPRTPDDEVRGGAGEVR